MPGEILIVDVMGLVIQHHQILEAPDALQHRALLLGQVFLRSPAQERLNGVLGRPSPIARLL